MHGEREVKQIQCFIGMELICHTAGHDCFTIAKRYERDGSLYYDLHHKDGGYSSVNARFVVVTDYYTPDELETLRKVESAKTN